MSALRRRRLLALLGAGAIAGSWPARGEDPDATHREAVRRFIDELAATGDFDPDWLAQVLAAAGHDEAAQRWMTPPEEVGPAPDWHDYRERHLDPARLRAGLAFWDQHQEVLERATLTYGGVAPEAVLAILGLESLYGRITGRHRELDVLATLAFDYPRRAPLYREELRQFLLLCREQRWDPLALRGSVAGAIGMPQFLPSSVRRYGVDFDGDGHLDLAGDPADAIASVANFLAAQGWIAGRPIASVATSVPPVARSLAGGIRAGPRWAELRQLGVEVEEGFDDGEPVLLIDLPYQDAGGGGADFMVGTTNLAAVLAYNRSYFYGAAVALFARRLRLARPPSPPAPAPPQAAA